MDIVNRSPTDALIATRARYNRVTRLGAKVAAVSGLIAAVSFMFLHLTARQEPAGRAIVAPRSANASMGGPTPAAIPKSSVAPQARTLFKLPEPTGYAAGVPIGYPQSDAGAVAAAYGYSRIASGLDVQATLRNIQAVADPGSKWFPNSRAQIGDGLVQQRRQLGLPAAGSTGNAGLAVDPVAYQIVGTTRTSATVLTLDQISAQTVDGTNTTGTVVFRWLLRWDGSRWLVTAPFSSTKDDALATVPFTSDAAAKGWQVVDDG